MSNQNNHPSKDITGSDGNELLGKKIVQCITGSVASYHAIDLARLLMRHGADVLPVMSPASEMMVSPEMMKWATGNKVVTALTGDLEHIALADYKRSDLIIVYPCTANTIGKTASGIDDTPVTSILTVGLGAGIPIVMAPAMHEAMFGNQFISENIQKLEHAGVVIVKPTVDEGKAKVAEPEEILREAIMLTSQKKLSGTRLLVTAGSTVEYIDPVRVITNLSSGKMGVAIAKQARAMGADVKLIFGVGTERPGLDKVLYVKTSSEMYDAVFSELGSEKYDVLIMTAAVADFAPERTPEKIESRKGPFELKLSPTRKIVDDVKEKFPAIVLVAFKAEWGLSDSALLDKARNKLNECNADFIVANDLAVQGAQPGSDTSQVYIVGRNNLLVHLPLMRKQKIAEKLIDIISDNMASRNLADSDAVTSRNS